MFRCQRIWICLFVVLAVSIPDACAFEVLIEQFNWTAGLGEYGLGVRGYEDMTSLCYGPGQFNVSVSGHSFLVALGLR